MFPIVLSPLGLLPSLPLAISIPVENPYDQRYIVAPGTGYDGVVEIRLPDDSSCTGSLLTTGRHVITAAHCFPEAFQREDQEWMVEPSKYSVIFHFTEGQVAEKVAFVSIHPAWKLELNHRADLAIIHLAESAPATVDRYEIYRETDEAGTIFTQVGFGVAATGINGEFEDDETVIKRIGKNRYEGLTKRQCNPLEPCVKGYTQLFYDYDSGLPANDAIGQEHGKPDLGLGLEETSNSLGDSGGPGFIDGKIAGISIGGELPNKDGVDINQTAFSSFGEYSLHLRVTAYASYIDQVLSTKTPTFSPSIPQNISPSIEPTQSPLASGDWLKQVLWLTGIGGSGLGILYWLNNPQS